HAAAALCLASPAEMGPRAIEILTTPLGEMTEEASPMTDTVGKLVSACIARLPTEHVDRAVDAIGSTLASAEVMTNLAATNSLLRLVFGVDVRGDGRAPSNAAQLSPVQRKALTHIVEHGGFGKDGNTFGNYFLLLRGWKL